MKKEKAEIIDAEFRDVPEGCIFWKRGLTYIKIDSGGAEMPGIFGKRRCPFSKTIKVKMKAEDKKNG